MPSRASPRALSRRGWTTGARAFQAAVGPRRGRLRLRAADRLAARARACSSATGCGSTSASALEAALVRSGCGATSGRRLVGSAADHVHRQAGGLAGRAQARPGAGLRPRSPSRRLAELTSPSAPQAAHRAAGYQVSGPADGGDPSGRAWTEHGRHRRARPQHTAKLPRAARRARSGSSCSAIEGLLDDGWQQVVVVTDHGWLSCPAGCRRSSCPSTSRRTEKRKGRTARAWRRAPSRRVPDGAVALGPRRPGRLRAGHRHVRRRPGVRPRRPQPAGVRDARLITRRGPASAAVADRVVDRVGGLRAACAAAGAPAGCARRPAAQGRRSGDVAARRRPVASRRTARHRVLVDDDDADRRRRVRGRSSMRTGA